MILYILSQTMQNLANHGASQKVHLRLMEVLVFQVFDYQESLSLLSNKLAKLLRTGLMV